MSLRERMRRWVSPGTGYDEVVVAAPQRTLWEVVRRFWPAARPYRKWIPLLLVLIAIGALIETAEIWIFKLVVDEVLVPADLGLLPWLAIGYVGLTLIGGLINFGDDYLSTWIAERFLLNLRVQVLEHVQRLSIDVFNRHRLGDLVTRVNDDVGRIETLVLSGVTDGLSAVLHILFFGGALFVLNWKLALVALVVIPPFLFVARHFARLVRRASREHRRRVGSLSSVAEETFANAPLIQATNAQESVTARFRRQNEGAVEAELAAARIHGIFTPVIDLIELMGLLVVLVLGTVLLADGELTIGGLLVFLAYLSQLYDPVRELGSLANSFFRALAGAERVIELLDEEPRVRERPGARDIGRARGAVTYENVSLTYPGAESPALVGVSLDVRPGETVALVGPSGAGKSTLARLLIRLYDPDEGNVLLDGQNLRELTLASVRDNVAILFQDALALHGTVAENIALGKPGATREEIERAARAANADEFIAALPNGYDTDIGERGGRLSGGQRQRVAIARALLADSPVLLLDEPTTGLDATAREALLAPLRTLTSERTTIVVSHDLLMAREADRIAVLEAGRIVELGDHDSLVAQGGLYARLWALHSTSNDAAPEDELEIYAPER